MVDTLYTSLITPQLIRGVPRTVFLFNVFLTLMIAFILRKYWYIAIGILIHYLIKYLIKNVDIQFFGIIQNLLTLPDIL